METRALELFLDLARTLRFRTTARRCHLTPSALTRAIARLETEVGQPLLVRDRRSVKLTPAGIRFRDYATRAVEDWRAFMEQASASPAGMQGELAVYCSVTASYCVMPKLLAALRQSYPGVAVRLRAGDAEHGIERVLDGEVDAALVPIPRRPVKQVELMPLLETPLVLIGPVRSSPLERQLSKGLPWTQMPLILPEAGPARVEIESWFKARRLRPMVHATVTGNEAILSMVSLGLGLGVVPRLVAEHAPTSVRVQYLADGPALHPYVIALCTRRTRKGNGVIDALRTAAKSAFAQT
jgi:LysR family positive regulator for ilvC